MKPKSRWLGLLALSFLPLLVHALSRPIGRDIEFPGNYDTQKAEAIRQIIRNEQFRFVDGTVSYWPPDWGTRLSFEGDASSLNEFLKELRSLRGISLRLILYRGRQDELRKDSSWQLDYSRARPDQLTIFLNINSAAINFQDLTFPEWPER